jgi:putative ATPase
VYTVSIAAAPLNIFSHPFRCGKTTLARLLAKQIDAIFKELSATDAGISDIRAVIEDARGALTLAGRYIE